MFTNFLPTFSEVIIIDDRITIDNLKPATPGSAGIDLMACNVVNADGTHEQLTGDLVIEPGQQFLIGCGVKIYLNKRDATGLLFPRSGLGTKRGLVLGNLTGIIDEDYQGQTCACIWNRGNKSQIIKPLERIVQYIVVPVIHPKFIQVTEFTPTERGEGGFGSTGKGA